MKGETLRIQEGLEIPVSELTFRFSRSGGPGGQHANRSATQVELLFDLAHSPSLSAKQRRRLLRSLAPHLDSRGILHLTSGAYRSQHQNREEVTSRFVRLLQKGLRRRRPRLPTRPSAGSVRRRIEEKRRRGTLKRSLVRKDWRDE